MPAANVIQLRQLLAEKFPGLRTQAEAWPANRRKVWPTGLSQLDEPLRGGLPAGALAEIVAGQRGSGSALLLAALLRRAARENRFVALVDGIDSFDVTAVEQEVLSRLLWIRCRAAEEALKAADLLLRDGNLPLLLLDLAANPPAQLRAISPTSWYRLQRIAEQTSTVSVVFTPYALVSPAQVRLTLHSRFLLDALEREPEELLCELRADVSEARRFGDGEARRFA